MPLVHNAHNNVRKTDITACEQCHYNPAEFIACLVTHSRYETCCYHGIILGSQESQGLLRFVFFCFTEASSVNFFLIVLRILQSDSTAHRSHTTEEYFSIQHHFQHFIKRRSA
jgi:hypothetical protein